MNISDKVMHYAGVVFGNGAAGLFTLGAYESFGLGAALGVGGIWATLLAIGFHREEEVCDV